MRRELLVAFLFAPALAAGGGIVGSKHDLSVTGPGPVKAQTETRVCVFCHIAHRGGRLGNNRPDVTARHQLHASSTASTATPGGPTGATRICLSCHDGTIALGETVASGVIQMSAAAPGGRMPPGRKNLGTDLRGSHPVSVAPMASAKVRRPAPGDQVHLDRAGQIQCTSCHDPHEEDLDPVEGSFLVKNARGSALCLSCHNATVYQGTSSSHFSSTIHYAPAQGNETGYGSIAETGCMSCHRTHAADPNGALVKRGVAGGDDEVCLGCHDGRVARLDVARQRSKPYAHADDGRGHDPAEGPANGARRLPEASAGAPRHVACVDCHDPHAAYAQDAAAPRSSGPLAGVWGIDVNGQRVEPARYQYEVCFKCHGDSANQPQARGPTPPSTVRRAAADVNLRRVFNPSSPSYHPVAAPGRNAEVPSLIPPLTPSSVIYCTDCHASDDGPGANASPILTPRAAVSPAPGEAPRGPHGSVYPHLLERSYGTADDTPESPMAYALCYKCHDREKLFGFDPVTGESVSSFEHHRLHVIGGRAPCSACHDPHGVSSLAGNPINNAHLVSFDVSIVRANGKGFLGYVSAGRRHGSCNLSCHGVEHDARGY